MGRLGRDPEICYTAEGTAVANFSLAPDESFTDRAGDRQVRTEWHRIVVWQRLAEICGEYLAQGKQVYIEGSLRSRKWKDSEGNERTTIEVVATRTVMLGSKNGAQGSSKAGLIRRKCRPLQVIRPMRRYHRTRYPFKQRFII
jgi:single-strand DNA-binding protein